MCAFVSSSSIQLLYYYYPEAAAEENKDRKLLDLFIGSLPPTTPTYYSITTLLYLVVLGQGPSVDGTILLGVVL